MERIARNTYTAEHLEKLRGLEVDLTSYLTQARADQIIEVRGQAEANHLHIGNDK